MDWGTFFSVFGLIFVAELGDKTQLAVITQTCKYRRPWAVFVGASTALGLVTALGVVGGQVLGRFLPDDLLRIAAAMMFVVVGLLIAREAAKADGGSANEDRCQSACEPSENGWGEGASISTWSWHAFGATFGLLFLAELGDKTQLAVLSLASRHGDAWAVLAGGVVALSAVTVLGVVSGQMLCRLVPQRLLLWFSAAVFVAMGALVEFGVF